MKPSLVLCGWALLLTAWVFGNPPFAATDESAHYIRAVDTTPGHLIGQPAPEQGVGETPLQTASLRHFTEDRWTFSAMRIGVRPAAGLRGWSARSRARR